MLCTCISMYISLPPLLECSEDDELRVEGDDELAREFLPSPPSSSRPPSPPGLSLLALSISVDSTRLSMLLHVEGDEEEASQV